MSSKVDGAVKELAGLSGRKDDAPRQTAPKAQGEDQG
jgi:hypothetical protein